jgi:HAE1 family hydrophobic/amphiphilic exporter-1
MGRRESLIEASHDRLRPIMMTAMTTIVGLLPMALGANDQGRMIYSPLAIAVLGGLISSTLLIPLLIPTIYSISDDIIARLKLWFNAIRAAARN